MRRFPRRSPDPWLRTSEESMSRNRHDVRRLTVAELLIAVTVIALVIGMAIWFLFIAQGGPGPGTV
jgi:hypothetical protein